MQICKEVEETVRSGSDREVLKGKHRRCRLNQSRSVVESIEALHMGKEGE